MGIDEITYGINGAIYEVNRLLGGGFLEKVYERALLFELKNRGFEVHSQVPIPVYYKQSLVGDYFADIIVENQVIIELKAVKHLDKSHEAQLLNYLKATNFSVGLLVNFSHSSAKIKRFVL